jgi:hypothetical protein
MSVQHASISDPNIHEPKGVTSASNGDVYVANGAGSGAWVNKNTLFPTPIYGIRFLKNNVTATSIPVADTWYAVAGDWLAGGIQGFEVPGMLIPVAGDYLVNLSWTAVQSGGTTEAYKIGPFTPQNLASQEYDFSLATGVPAFYSFSTIIRYEVGNFTNPRVKNTANANKGLTITNYNLSIHLLRNI